MAKPTTPAALRWNPAEYRSYTGPESMHSKRVTQRVASKCGRVVITRTSGEFGDFVIDVDGERSYKRMDIDGRSHPTRFLHSIRLAKRIAALLAAA